MIYEIINIIMGIYAVVGFVLDLLLTAFALGYAITTMILMSIRNLKSNSCKGV